MCLRHLTCVVYVLRKYRLWCNSLFGILGNRDMEGFEHVVGELDYSVSCLFLVLRLCGWCRSLGLWYMGFFAKLSAEASVIPEN